VTFKLLFQLTTYFTFQHIPEEALHHFVLISLFYFERSFAYLSAVAIESDVSDHRFGGLPRPLFIIAF